MRLTSSSFRLLTLACLATLGHASPGSSRPPSTSTASESGTIIRRHPRSVPLESTRNDVTRWYTYTAGYDKHYTIEKKRINFRSPATSPGSTFSLAQDLIGATDEIAKILRRKRSTLKPSRPLSHEESVEVDDKQAELLEELQAAFPNLNHDEVVVEGGRISDCIRGIKRKAKRSIQCLLSCCRKSHDNTGLLNDRKNEARWAGMSVEQLTDDLKTNLSSGLTSDQVQMKQETVGRNELDKPQSTPFYEILWGAVNSAIVYLMAVGVLALFATKEFIEAIVMLLCVAFVIVMGTIPEYDATRQADNLAIEEPGNVQVMRNGEWNIISAIELVPGDIISLRAGDRVPADCRIVQAHDLNVAEAELTGESELLEKHPEALTQAGKSGTYHNLIMMGTLIAIGDCMAVVVETGMRARYGSIQNLLIMNERKSTPITDKVESLVLNFTKVTVVVAILLGVVCMALRRRPDPHSKENLYLQNFLLAIGLCIAVVPEGLPITCTLSLNKGMSAMLRSCNTRVRTMSAVECLSAIDVFCTDKTGTLTTGEMTVVGVYVPDTEFRMLPDGQAIEGEICAVRNPNQSEIVYSGDQLDLIMLSAALCNSAERLEDGKWQGQMSDVALARVAYQRHADTKGFVKVATNTFDSKRKMMSVVVENSPPNPIFGSLHQADLVAIVKGAPEIILHHCDEIQNPNKEVHQISSQDKAELLERIQTLSSSGFRGLALAYRPILKHDDLSSQMVEDRLIFIGLTTIMDPLRDSVPDTVSRLHRAGIAVKMITGDSVLTATAIAKQARILDDDSDAIVESSLLRNHRCSVDELKLKLLFCGYKSEALLKNRLDLLEKIDQYLDPNDHAATIAPEADQAQTMLDDFVEKTLVFARAQPEDKVTIVESLQRRKHIVAMTGDGVNDAPALKKADAGIAVYTATDLTKRAAPVNLLDSDFSRVGQLISEGRRVAHNMVKAVFCMFAGNVGELGPFFGQPFGLPPPLRTLQVLWLNANTDIFNIVPFSNDQPFRDLMLDPPIPPSAPVLHKWLWFQIIVINLLTTVCSFAIELFVLRSLTGSFLGRIGSGQTESNERALVVSSTAVMTFMVMSQLLLSYTCRDLTKTAFGLYFFTNRSMHIAVIISAALSLAVPYVPKLSGWLSMRPMPADPLIMALALSLVLPLGHEFLKSLFKILGIKRIPVPKSDPEMPSHCSRQRTGD